MKERCPFCDHPLENAKRPYGSLWVCRGCRRATTTLALLRRLAPRDDLRALWRVARTRGLPTRFRCPFCRNPLVEAPTPLADWPSATCCTHCYMVWLARDALRRIPVRATSARDEERRRAQARALVALLRGLDRA